MKFNKLLFWWGLRPLTADILYDEHMRAIKKRMLNEFEDTIVPELIKYGKYIRRISDSDEAKVMEDILTKAKIRYITRKDPYGDYYIISIKNEVH